MTDVTINRCTLRIVRHGGWSWGPEPRRLLQSAIRALPDLLAPELSKLWTDDVDREIAAPVSITIFLQMHDLLAAADAASIHGAPRTPSVIEAISKQIGRAARAAFASQQISSESESATQPVHSAQPEMEIPRESSFSNSVLQVLLSWQEAGTLSLRLADFALSALEAWHTRLLVVESVSTRAAEPSEAVIRQFHEKAAQCQRWLTSGRERILRQRIVLLVEIMAEFNLRWCTPALRENLDEALPLNDERAEERAEEGAEECTEKRAEERAEECTEEPAEEPAEERAEKLVIGKALGRLGLSDPVDLQIASQVESATQLLLAEVPAREPEPLPNPTVETLVPEFSVWERSITSQQTLYTPSQNPQLAMSLSRGLRGKEVRRVASALPFLLLGPLSRLGYWKTLAATMEAANAPEALPLFAGALAYKVLTPPGRGWRREPDAVAAATAFAALDQPVAEPDLVDLARCLSDFLSPLETALAGALVAGHDGRKPLLLYRTPHPQSGYLLLDSEGIFPIKWAATAVGLRTYLIQLEPSPILIPQQAAETKLLSWLNEEGFRFITDARPTRGEPWRALHRPGSERWYTNDMITSDSRLMQMARMTRVAAEDAETLWQKFAVERPSIPLAADPALDRHLTLAASIALATVAWELWREREPTAPHVALERFRDLEARVYYSRDSVRVGLPLGRRSYDLRDHHLIDDVDDVPWLDGRTVTFGSG